MDQDINKNYSQENGKRRRPPVRYDENGNPIPPKKRPPVRYDENGNPIPPKKRPPVRYDENGNPIPPKKRPPVRYDENGNPIPPKKRPPVRYDENGNPIPFFGMDPKKPINEGLEVPYQVCTKHTKEAWEQYVADHPWLDDTPDEPEVPVDPEVPDVPNVPGKTEDPTDDPKPSFEITKEITNSDGKPYGFGDEIKYRVVLTNTGNVSLTETVIEDVAGANNDLTTFEIGTVAPGETVTFEYSYTVQDGDLRPTYKADGVTPEDHYVTNTATVITKPANDLENPMTGSDSVTHEVEQWYHAIFVDTRTNEVVEFINVPYGGSIELPDAPEHRGYNFLGWRYPILNNITFNQVVYAYYERDTVTIYDARIPLAGGYISNVGDCFD